MRTEDEIRADAAPRAPFSNGTEWEIFADRQCYECVHDNPNADPEVFCPIITVALTGNNGRAAWPKEWTSKFVKFGDYVDEARTRRLPIETTADDPEACEYVGECTEFEQRPEPGDEPEPEPEPPPEVEGQLDLIDAYLDTALAELTPRLVDSLPERQT